MYHIRNKVGLNQPGEIRVSNELVRRKDVRISRKNYGYSCGNLKETEALLPKLLRYVYDNISKTHVRKLWLHLGLPSTAVTHSPIT